MFPFSLVKSISSWRMLHGADSVTMTLKNGTGLVYYLNYCLISAINDEVIIYV